VFWSEIFELFWLPACPVSPALQIFSPRNFFATGRCVELLCRTFREGPETQSTVCLTRPVPLRCSVLLFFESQRLLHRRLSGFKFFRHNSFFFLTGEGRISSWGREAAAGLTWSMDFSSSLWYSRLADFSLNLTFVVPSFDLLFAAPWPCDEFMIGGRCFGRGRLFCKPVLTCGSPHCLVEDAPADRSPNEFFFGSRQFKVSLDFPRVPLHAVPWKVSLLFSTDFLFFSRSTIVGQTPVFHLPFPNSLFARGYLNSSRYKCRMSEVTTSGVDPD